MSEEWENKPPGEIYEKDTSDKGLLPKIYRLIKLNNKKTKTTWRKNGPKTLTDTSPSKIHRQQINIWKEVLHHFSLGKCKQHDITTHLFFKCQNTDIPNADKDVEQFSFTASGNANWYSHFGCQFGSFLWN